MHRYRARLSTFLAIGKRGQNARLAAKLTGFKIDIKSETEAEGLFSDRQTSEASEEPTPEDNESAEDDTAASDDQE